MSIKFDTPKNISQEEDSESPVIQRSWKSSATPSWKSSAEPVLMKKKDPSVQMPEEVQAKMENSFGQDFSDVNIHKDSPKAESLNALAYTQGNNVHFAPGEFQPQTKSGQELIGHELTHVVQQRSGKVNNSDINGKDMVNSDPALEQEADIMGKNASEGKVNQHNYTPSNTPSDNNPIQRFEAPGHEAAERKALTEGNKFSNDEASMVYFGNWMRDMNQALVPALGQTMGNDTVFSLIKVLAIKKFGREVNPEQFGYYIPSEHIDNPGGQIADLDYYKSAPKIADSIAKDGAKDRFNTQDFKPRDPALDTPQESTEPTAKILGAPIFSVDQKGVLAYIRRTNIHVENRLTLATERGRNADGMMHFGAALHSIEDLFAHSNYVEIALNKVLEHDPNVISEIPLLPELKGADRKVQTLSSSVNIGGKNRPVLTTGTFTGLDTMESVGSEAVKMMRIGLGPAASAAEREAQEAMMSAMLHKMDKIKSSAPAQELIASLVKQIPPLFQEDAKKAVNNSSIGGLYDWLRKIPGLGPLFNWFHNEVSKVINTVVLTPMADQVEAHALTSKVQDTPLFKGYQENKEIADGDGTKTTALQDLSTTITGEPVNATKNKNEAQAKVTQYNATPSKIQASASHSQLAKDHSNSIFFGLAFKLAVEADKMLRDKIIVAWNDNTHEADPGKKISESNDKYSKEYDKRYEYFPGAGLAKKKPEDEGVTYDLRKKAGDESLKYGDEVYKNGKKKEQEYDLEEMRISSSLRVFMVANTIRGIADAPSNASQGIAKLQKLMGDHRIKNEFAEKSLNKALKTTQAIDEEITDDLIKRELKANADNFQETAIAIKNAKTLKQREDAYSKMLVHKNKLLQIIKSDLKRKNGKSLTSAASYSLLLVMIDREMAIVAPAYTSQQISMLNDPAPTKELQSSIINLPAYNTQKINAKPGLKDLLDTSRKIINHPYESDWWKKHVIDFVNQHSAQVVEEIKARNAGYTNMGGEHKH